MAQRGRGGRGGGGGGRPNEGPPSEARGPPIKGKSSAPAGPPAEETPSEGPTKEEIDAVKTQRRPPVKGKLGRALSLHSNFFRLDISKLRETAYHYDVAFEPEVKVRKIGKLLIGECERLNKFGAVKVVFDGKNLYTVHKLPLDEFVLEDIELPMEEGEEGKRARKFKLVIRLVAVVPLVSAIAAYLKGTAAETPRAALQVLDIALSYGLSKQFPVIGKSIFYPHDQVDDLGEGAEVWRGNFISVRPTERGLALNLDTAATVMVKPGPVIDYCVQKLRRWDPSQRLYPDQVDQIQYELKKMRVEVHHSQVRRKYQVMELGRQGADQDKFNRDGTVISVADYFAQQYNIKLKYPHLPCLKCGKKLISLPMELCRLVPGQRHTRAMTGEQRTKMLDFTTQMPGPKEQTLMQSRPLTAIPNDPYVKEFGVIMDQRMADTSGRGLESPALKYKDKTGRDTTMRPQNGQWNLSDVRFFEAAPILSWVCINFADPRGPLRQDALQEWLVQFTRTCQAKGMKVGGPPPILNGDLRRIRNSLDQLRDRPPSIALITLPNDRSPGYDDIKKICETELGLVTQCLDGKKIGFAKKSGPAYQLNVALKTNVKLGGVNTDPAQVLPCVGDKPTMVMGADVHHPPPADTDSASVAAVVGSFDRNATKYNCVVRHQSHRQEIIKDMQEATVRLLREFFKTTKLQPQRIIMFRDGVGESQFDIVFRTELAAMRRACRSLDPNYKPTITFIIVQKRNRARIFPSNRQAGDPKGNLLPGTVVDTTITHPFEHDFFMCSHAGLKGTSKPTHYHVMYDDNGFPSDAIQDLTYRLCHTYQRCARAVSVPAPAYYAHLASYRARLYGLESGRALAPNLASRLFYA